MSRVIKHNDIVACISGSQRGRHGKVLKIYADRERALVEGLQLIRKHQRKTQDDPQGGIVEKEAPIHLSNLRLFCSQCKSGVKALVDRSSGSALRTCARCGHSLEP